MLGQENYLDSSTKKFEEEKIGQRRFKNNLKANIASGQNQTWQ